MRTNDGRLHFSELKRIGTHSPKHYRHFADCPFDEKDTAQYRVGRAMHRMWLLGIEPPPVFDGKRDQRTKRYKEFLEALGVQHSEVLDADEHKRVLGMCAALDSHPAAVELREKCELFEREMEWTRGDIECCGTLDMSTKRHGIICDLKSCESARPESFQRKAARYAYDCQLAWYSYPFDIAEKWPDCYIIAVESSPPYDVVVHRLSPLLLDMADKRIEEWLATWKSCQANGTWPGYSQDIVDWNIDPDRITTSEDD